MAKCVTCSCGHQVDLVRYVEGKRVCEFCKPINRSGTFLRKLEGETREYNRDILQVVKDGALNPDFIEVYGKEKAEKALKDHARRNI